MDEIRSDMRRPHPMNRLVQGDVGSGKTVVAVAAMMDAIESGYQAALMSPTGILAEQHYLNIRRMTGPLGLTVSLQTGGSGGAAQHNPDECAADIIIGTHALIQERIRYRKLGLVVIDEQHKFGVLQRALLRKKGADPDVLVMTATPIPRSLALTLYGDLDYSVIDALPPGRKPVHTVWRDAGNREEIFGVLRKEIGLGRQAYVVYPSIAESETADLKSAVRGKEAFEKKFPEFRIGLLHGRMKPEERERVMDLFKSREIDILISTTVIEVGVDVPNATVMLIVHAERFGLSQLHQLRGRVGRGTDRACCILIAYPPLGEEARRRLAVMGETNDGFRIAEEDLAIRGPGTFLGTRQTGHPDLRNADIVKDAEILESARCEAFALLERDGELRKIPFLKQQLDVFWKGKADLFRTG
jgi:ATP-dependent DNA helicase RecG